MTVRVEDVDAAIDKALGQGANALQWIWNGLPPAERIVMAVMAEAKEEKISQDELTEILNRSKVRLILRDLELAPETLIRWDLLRPVDNAFRFAIPLLRRWVAAEKPLRRVKAELDSMEPLAESLYHSGEGFYKMGNLDDAEQQLRRALNINPNHFRARLLLGQVLIGQGNLMAAVAELEPAYQFDPRSARPGLIAALLALAETQNEDEQLKTYNKILAIEPTQVVASEKKRTLLSGLAEAALRKADFETALKIYAELGDDNNVHAVQTKKLQVDQQLTVIRKYEEAENWSGICEIYEELLAEFPEQENWRARLKLSQYNKKVAEESQEFEFDVITVNERGEKITRELGKAYQQVEDLGNGVIVAMVYIPGGTFLMGSPKTEKERLEQEGPQHEVTITAFYMGKYPVTQEQWEAVMKTNPSYFKGANRPVEQVSWDEAVEFCRRLNEKLRRNGANPPLPLPGGEYRLPSEAEWEYACRAGTTTPFHFGETITPELANYDGNYPYASGPKGIDRKETTEVGRFPPNAFGLYDMHGNVWEWCQDWYDQNYYAQSPKENPSGPASGSYRVSRGGGWNDDAWGCRSACRGGWLPDRRVYGVGFRLLRTPS